MWQNKVSAVQKDCCEAGGLYLSNKLWKEIQANLPLMISAIEDWKASQVAKQLQTAFYWLELD